MLRVLSDRITYRLIKASMQYKEADAVSYLGFLQPSIRHPSTTTAALSTTTSCNITESELTFNFSTQTVCDLMANSKYNDVLDTQWRALIIASYSTLIAAGIVCNALVCCVVVRKCKRRATQHVAGNARNVFILNLAIADLALCCVSMPLTLHNLLHFHWAVGVLLCKLAPVIQAANMLVSAGTITAIALDRYYTIVRSPRGRGHVVNDSRRTPGAACIVAVMWLASLLFTSPLFFYTHLDSVYINKVFLYDRCVDSWPSHSSKLVFSLAMTSVQFIIPVSILSSIHFKISAFLRLHLRPLERPQIQIDSPLEPRNENHDKVAQDDNTLLEEKLPVQKEFLNINRKESICSENSQRSESSRKYSDCSDSKRYSPDISPRRGHGILSSFRDYDFSFSFSKLSQDSSRKNTKCVRRELRRNRRTTLLLACIACVYAVSWLPYHIYSIAKHAAPLLVEPATLYKAFAAAHLLAMTSVCVNPFVYGWLNTNFRREFLHIFTTFSICFSKLSKKGSKIISHDAEYMKDHFEGAFKKKTVLSFVDSRQPGVVVALYPGLTPQPDV